MKRRAVIKKIEAEARRQGLPFETREMTRHLSIKVGNVSKTLSRHSEVPEPAARSFFDQFAEVLGKGWWR